MKIAYLSGTPIPSSQAASVHVMKMCRALAAHGHEVTCYARTGTSNVEAFSHYGVDRAFDLVRIGRPAIPGLGAAGYSVGVLNAVRRDGIPDLFYSRYPPALMAASVLPAPMVMEIHIVTERRVERWAQHYLLRHKRLARVVVISESLRRDYLEAFPFVDPGAVMVAHDGADALALGLREKHGPGGAVTAAYAGSFYKGRGIDLVLALAERLPSIEFHLAGGGREDLARLGLLERVAPLTNVHLHGVLPPAAVTAFLASKDILLAPYGDQVTVADRGDISRWISPLKIFEYMAVGRPIVSTALPTIAEVLEDGSSAILCPSNDVEAWAGEIQRLSRDPDLGRRLGDKARADLEARYTWKARAALVLDGLGPRA